MMPAKNRELSKHSSSQPTAKLYPDFHERIADLPRELPPSVARILDVAAVKRIIAHTNVRKPKSVSPDLENLRIDISWCLARFNSSMQLGSKPIAKRRLKQLERVARAAASLTEMFDDDVVKTWVRNSIAGAFRKRSKDADSSLLKVLHGVKTIGEIALQQANENEPFGLTKLDRNPFDFVVGVLFRQVFEHHFLSEATVSRPSSGGSANSPFIRFASAALTELGIQKSSGASYQSETIAKALTHAKNGRSRRQGSV